MAQTEFHKILSSHRTETESLEAPIGCLREYRSLARMGQGKHLVLNLTNGVQPAQDVQGECDTVSFFLDLSVISNCFNLDILLDCLLEGHGGRSLAPLFFWDSQSRAVGLAYGLPHFQNCHQHLGQYVRFGEITLQQEQLYNSWLYC